MKLETRIETYDAYPYTSDYATRLRNKARKIWEGNNKHTYCQSCLRELSYADKVSLAKDCYACIECGSKGTGNNNCKVDYLTMPIWKIGIELEGLWEDYPEAHKLLVQHEDCSVKNLDSLDVEWVGEYITRPVLFRHDKLHELESVIYKSYPTYVNRTCGGHFHLSFRDMRFYDIAMNEEMYHGLIAHLYSWGEKHLNKIGMERLVERIEVYTHGTDYCKPQHMPESQVNGDGDRYCQLNFDYFKHKTMEVRVLPMFSSAETYLDAVNTCTNYISNYVIEHSNFKGNKSNLSSEFDISGKIDNIEQKYGMKQ